MESGLPDDKPRLLPLDKPNLSAEILEFQETARNIFIRDAYSDKYDTHIADMVESLKVNKKVQDILTIRGWSIDYDVLKQTDRRT
ncbi:hypothetical protein ACFVX6_19155 [Streptomyces sp. NPDC058289]|uniref:hypothetical protein n=1 Tax=Streptomyces sp. NPDC058289 TaxID=3346425 RepID=UPI0036E1FB8F